MISFFFCFLFGWFVFVGSALFFFVFGTGGFVISSRSRCHCTSCACIWVNTADNKKWANCGFALIENRCCCGKGNEFGSSYFFLLFFVALFRCVCVMTHTSGSFNYDCSPTNYYCLDFGSFTIYSFSICCCCIAVWVCVCVALTTSIVLIWCIFHCSKWVVPACLPVCLDCQEMIGCGGKMRKFTANQLCTVYFHQYIQWICAHVKTFSIWSITT